ncbi:hypothetical protein E2C01_085182 [Portunus trituberculatus]|uniref:Uncharacterized protein n=1 Tax=Portunus trituberculatus TaxID=210409 RepID=A0A5B7JB84_PORTR|nr:hypothetical protein [Portunus trituberculatus]
MQHECPLSVSSVSARRYSSSDPRQAQVNTDTGPATRSGSSEAAGCLHLLPCSGGGGGKGYLACINPAVPHSQ